MPCSLLLPSSEATFHSALFCLLFITSAGGLDENVNESVIHAAMLPFGDIKDVNIPLEQSTQKNRGFGFVTFTEKYARGIRLVVHP